MAKVLNTLRFETPEKLEIAPAIKKGYETLINGTGAGAEMRGWMNWSASYLKSEEYARLKETAAKIQKEFKHAVVIGIGGSYLGAKTFIDAAIGDPNSFKAPCSTKVHFVASISASDWKNIERLIGDDSYCIIFISKSGTTLEPGLALRYFYELHKKIHGTAPTVYSVTDKSKGTGRNLTNDNGWESFIIPDNIGGRYSVFTAVGMLPVAVAGIDTDKLLNAAALADEVCYSSIDNLAVHYANNRYLKYLAGYLVEMFAFNNPCLRSFAEWWKQLFGESEGKDGKGLIPHCFEISKDLHSLGQLIQGGLRDTFIETYYNWLNSIDIVFPESNLKDGLDYLVGHSLSEVNKAATEGSFIAHSTIGPNPNPCTKFDCPSGIEWIAFSMEIFEWACPISGYAIEVNPFDQPDVEGYKKMMMKKLKNS